MVSPCQSWATDLTEDPATALATHQAHGGTSQLGAQPRMRRTFQVQEQTRISGCMCLQQQVTPCPADREDQTYSNRSLCGSLHPRLGTVLDGWGRRLFISRSSCMQAAAREERRSAQDTARGGTVNATTSGTIRARINLPWSQTRVMLMRTCPQEANYQVSERGLPTS